jgi:hypothetical protein
MAAGTATSLAKPEPQAPNRATVWSQRQRPKNEAMVGPRFIEVNLDSQPRPLSAIELLKQAPVLSVKARTVACDGGGLLGHPKVFINLVLAKFADPDYRMIRLTLERVDIVDSNLNRIRIITKSLFISPYLVGSSIFLLLRDRKSTPLLTQYTRHISGRDVGISRL